MMQITRRRLGLLAVLAIGAVALIQGAANALPAGTAKLGMVCTPGSVSGSGPTTHTFNLQASSGTITTPDGNSVFMWSYAVAPPDDPNGSGGVWPDFQSPGPVLCVTQGETVVINLTNNLPEATSIVFPGQDAEVTFPAAGSLGLMTHEAAVSGTVSYSFTAGSPGTYLY